MFCLFVRKRLCVYYLILKYKVKNQLRFKNIIVCAMSCLAVSDKFVAVAKGLSIDCFDHTSHIILDATSEMKSRDSDYIVDVIISSDNKFLAAITAQSKELILFSISDFTIYKRHTLPRSASKIRFFNDNKHILVADKTGDALLFDFSSPENGQKILGHLSLLLDILQTSDGKFIITSDRDEKIKVSHYPNTYNIQTYCLGHKEFVNHIEEIPHNKDFLLSTSGDGTIKIWDHSKGENCHTVDTSMDVDDVQLKENFIKCMDDEGIQVNTLPIVHCAVTLLQDCSLVAITVYNYNRLLIYSLHSDNIKFTHKLRDTLTLEKFPTAVKFNKSSLYIYNEWASSVQIYNCANKACLESEIVLFKDKSLVKENVIDSSESIKVLYKRKFDNVQEYQERKKQRLEKSQ